jgi:PKD repeat protein
MTRIPCTDTGSITPGKGTPGPGRANSRRMVLLLFGTLALPMVAVHPGMSLPPAAVEWERAFGGAFMDEGFGLAPVPGGGYFICGYSRGDASVVSSDALLIRTDGDGNALWSRKFGGERYDGCKAMAATREGGPILAGATLSFTPGYSQAAWLLRTDPDGNELWNRTYGNGASLVSVLETPDGGFVAGGTSQGGDAYLLRTTAEGTTVWERTFGGPQSDWAGSVTLTSDGGFALTGTTLSFGTGNGYERMIWLIRTDGNGIELWNRTYGGIRMNYGYQVAEVPGGGFIVAGYADPNVSHQNRTVYLVRTAADGTLLWAKTPGDHGLDEGWSVSVMPDGGFLVGGMSWTKAFLQKTDSAGNLLWDERTGAAPNSYFSAVKQAPDGGYIAAGSTETAPNNFDLYLVKFSPEVPKPVAGFSAVPVSGKVPLQVQFADTSQNSPTVRAWDFDDDGVVDDTSENPLHTYAEAGLYTVALTVSNAAGTNGTVKPELIAALLPLPGLEAAPTDPDGDGLFEDLDGDGRRSFNDVVLFFERMEWIGNSEPMKCFDMNANGRIDFDDVVRVFQEL